MPLCIVRTRLWHWFGTPGFARRARGLFTPQSSSRQPAAAARHRRFRGRTRKGGARGPEYGAGFTLLELMVAVAVAGLTVALAYGVMRAVLGTGLKEESRREQEHRVRGFLNGLGRNIASGRGIVSVSESELVLRNRAGMDVAYRWEDTLILVNGNPQPFRASYFGLEAVGPRRPHPDPSAPAPPWPPDSLDGNRDGTLEHAELDADFSGAIEGWETRYIGVLRVTVGTAGEDGALRKWSLAVHPRSRL